MAKKKKKTPYDKPKRYNKPKQKKIPPCPDPERYVLVQKKDGTSYWRLKRGTLKPAKLNPVLQAIADNKGPAMAAAARLVQALEPFISNRYSDLRSAAYKRNEQHFATQFTRSIMAEGKLSWSFFDGYDINPNCRLDQLINKVYEVTITNNSATVRIALSDNMVEKRRNYSITHFYFELILVSGDPALENSLRTENDISEAYPYMNHSFFDKGPKQYCELNVVIPEEKPFILILKAATRVGKAEAGYLHEGLKVVGWN
jgi:hypothetical protein